MDNIIDVATAEVKVGTKNKILVSSAIGSCVTVVAVYIKNKVVGIAQVLLPGKSTYLQEMLKVIKDGESD